MAGIVVKLTICHVERTFVIPTGVEESLTISVGVSANNQKTVRDVSTSLDMTEKRVGMTEKVGRSQLSNRRLLLNGGNRC